MEIGDKIGNRRHLRKSGAGPETRNQKPEEKLEIRNKTGNQQNWKSEVEL